MEAIGRCVAQKAAFAQYLRFFHQIQQPTPQYCAQVRLIDLNKQATRPFACHRARSKALAATGPDTFLAAGEDGTVRLFDLRASHRGHVAGRPGDVGGPQEVPSILGEWSCVGHSHTWRPRPLQGLSTLAATQMHAILC